MSGNFAIKGGGGGRLMANAILNFHFDFPPTSLSFHNRRRVGFSRPNVSLGLLKYLRAVFSCWLPQWRAHQSPQTKPQLSIFKCKSIFPRSIALVQNFTLLASALVIRWVQFLCNFAPVNVSELVRPQPCTSVTGTLWLRLHNGKANANGWQMLQRLCN